MRVVWLRVSSLFFACIRLLVPGPHTYFLKEKVLQRRKGFAITESQIVVPTLSANCVSWRLQYGASVV